MLCVIENSKIISKNFKEVTRQNNIRDTLRGCGFLIWCLNYVTIRRGQVPYKRGIHSK